MTTELEACDHSAHLYHTEDGRTGCDSCGEILPHPFEGARQLAPQGAGLATVQAGTIAELLSARTLPILAWAKALLEMGQFEDQADSDPGLDMIAAILGADTSEEALAASNMTTVEDMIGRDPGAHSPLLEITGANPLKSSFDEGPSCFTVVSATIVATGEQIKFSCGGRTVQAVILAHVNKGWLPFRCILTRRLKPTRAGFYPLNLEAGG